MAAPGRIPIVALFCLMARAASADCPDWVAQQKAAGQIPPCPPGNGTVLDDTFPAMAQVISDSPQNNTPASQEMTAEFVEETLRAAGDRVPLLLLPVRSDTYEFVKYRVKELAASDPAFAPYRDRWLKSLVRVAASPSYTWQQDYFESFIDRGTGMPVLREVRDYARAGYSTDHLAAAGTQGCALIQGGEKLPPPTEYGYKYDGAHSGGNIEGLPGGLCLHGNNQAWGNFAKYYCGDPGNEVVVDTDWLRVGHVDEIVATVKRPGVSPPCDFAVTFASPAKALELMRSRPNDRFVNFQSRAPGSLDYRYDSEPMKAICTLAKTFLRKTPSVTPGEPPVIGPGQGGGAGGAQGAHRPAPPFRLIREALADDGLLTDDDCRGLTNGQVAAAFDLDREGTGLLNQIIDAKQQEAKDRIRARLKDRLPGCSPELIDVPDLFTSDFAPVKVAGAPTNAPLSQRYYLPVDDKGHGVVDSVLPNPTNAVLVENTVISSHPQNDAFKSYLDQAYGGLGLRHRAIDTFDYAHVGYGNLHCSSHSIRFCSGGANAAP